jgi:uncharacterized protein (TIGR03118 family)
MKKTTGTMFAFALLSAACGAGSDQTASTTDDLAVSARRQGVTVTNLVSDQAGQAANVDANLVNAWGLAFNPAGGPAWVSNNGTGTSTVYDDTGALKLTVTVAGTTGATGSSNPTGQVFNTTKVFAGDLFIFATEDGELSGWAPGRGVTARFDASANATYKGLALGTSGYGEPRLFAANFKTGKVDVYDGTYAQVGCDGAFKDDYLPTGYAPFNVQAAGDEILVAFAQQDDAHHDEVAGPGKGFVDAFDGDGHLLRRIVSGGALNAPWGLAVAPAGWGRLGGALLVGNFGDGKVNAYDLHTGRSKGALVDAQKNPVVIEGLWALEFGGGADAQHLFFTAGPGDEAHGLFGRIDAQ